MATTIRRIARMYFLLGHVFLFRLSFCSRVEDCASSAGLQELWTSVADYSKLPAACRANIASFGCRERRHFVFVIDYCGTLSVKE